MKSKEDTKEEITQNEDKKSMQLGITFEKGIHFAKEPKHTQKTWGLLTHFRDQFWLWKIKKIDRPQTVKTFWVFPFCVLNLGIFGIFFWFIVKNLLFESIFGPLQEGGFVQKCQKMEIIDTPPK